MVKSKEMDMLNGNLFKKIIIFTIPVMLSGVLQLLFNACDLIVVGKFAGDHSLAAVGSTSALIHLIINLFIGVSVGANVAVARSIGRKDEDKCQKLVHTSILFSIIAGLFLTVFGIVAARYLLQLMDTTSDVLDKATLYLQIYFSGMIFNMIYNFGASILRSVGETKKPLYYLFLAGVVNVILNIFFVTVFDMDVDGVALATIISQAISAMLVIKCLMKKTGYVNLNLKKLSIDKKSLKEIVIIGLPAGIQGSLFSISNVFIQKAVNSFGSTAIVAGNTASNNIESFIYTSMNSFYQGCITFTSQNYGAGKIKNCKKVLINSLYCVIMTGIILGGVALLFSKPLLGLYINEKTSIEYGITRLTIIAFTYFLCGIMDVLVGSLRGLGYSIVPMIVSVLGICAFRLLWIYTVFKNNHTLNVLYVSYPISWILTALIHTTCLIFVFKKVKNIKFEKRLVEEN